MHHCHAVNVKVNSDLGPTQRGEPWEIAVQAPPARDPRASVGEILEQPTAHESKLVRHSQKQERALWRHMRTSSSGSRQRMVARFRLTGSWPQACRLPSVTRRKMAPPLRSAFLFALLGVTSLLWLTNSEAGPELKMVWGAIGLTSLIMLILVLLRLRRLGREGSASNPPKAPQ